jgi:hypothetical protein
VRSRRATRRSEHAGADLGPLVSYLVLREGTPVFDQRGRRIGVVEEVLGDMQLDIFEGLVVHTEPLPGRHLLAGADQVGELRERGVLLSVERDALRPYRESSRSDGEGPADGRLHALLRRAWDRLSTR